eukprot:TRINITY_DN3595_c0_g1_i1.p1 TRINITY_DN3595_c0_g1~~TRINITY_DN3595_c0_g1_i1.p1  ORF type:complete len:197 (-),score=14.35 TRINITY_DN3595_c0_g1_i1:36-626(-)
MATAHLRGCIWNSSKVSACTRKKLQKNSCRVDFKVQATGSQPSVQQKMILTEKQVAQFYKEGFLVLPKFASKEQCDKMKHAAISIAKEMGLEAEKKASIFSTKNQTEKSDQYFLDSANNISLFFEEDAFSETGQQLAIDRRINKIGHALHDLHPRQQQDELSKQLHSTACLMFQGLASSAKANLPVVKVQIGRAHV